MSIKKCVHPYYRVENGRLACVVCGASKDMPKIEDKEKKPESDKSAKGKKK